MAASTVSASTTVIVKPSDLNNWSDYQETAVGTAEFVIGPATPPAGVGSAQLTVNSTGRSAIAIADFAGTRLDEITTLSYSTYRTSGGSALALSLQFVFDNDITDADNGWKGFLVFEPYLLGSDPVTGTWQTWNALTSDGWWATGAPLNATCQPGYATVCTLADVLALYPNAGIHLTVSSPPSIVGILQFKAGGGWTSGFDGNVDNFVIGINGVETTFDFEPETPCTTVCYVDAVNGDDSFGGDTIGSAKKTIQAAIDTVSPSGTVRVLPGNYFETATNRFVTGAGGPHQFGLYIGTNKNGITVMGVTAADVPITDPTAVVAFITTNATNNFGYSGVFVEGDGVTLQGLSFGDNQDFNNKTIEVIGDDFTILHSNFDTSDGGSLYISDFEIALDTVKSYHIENNRFDDGTQIAITSGAGDSGPVSGRQIIDNYFDIPAAVDALYGPYPPISFNGQGGVAWFSDDVGGAIITGNTFAPEQQYIRARGSYIEGEFDWESYWNDNTYEKAVVTLEDLAMFDVRSYAYSVFTNVRRISGVIQPDIDDIAQNGDTVLVAAGTYTENVTVNKEVALVGPNAGANACAAVRADEAIISNSVVTISADNLTVDGFKFMGAPAAGWSITQGADTDNVDILNNLFTGINKWALYHTSGHFGTHWLVDGNNVDGWSGADGTGLLLWNMQDVQVTNNCVRNLLNPAGERGIGLDTVVNATVSNNTVTDLNRWGMQLASSFGNQTNATFSGNTLERVEVGIQIVGNKTGNVIDGVVIEDNQIANVTAIGIYLTKGSSDFSPLRNIEVDNNTITQNVGLLAANFGLIDARLDDIGPAHGAISITDNTITFNGTFGAATAAFGIKARGSVATLTITGNTFNGGSVGGTGVPETAGIYLQTNDAGYGTFPASAVINITQNDFNGLVNGVVVYDPIALTYGNMTAGTDVNINNNNVDGATAFGIRNGAGQLVDGTLNWWGSDSGPSGEGQGAGVPVSSNVTFCPWLDGPFNSGGAVAGPVTNTDTGEVFCTIQAAIDDLDTLDGHEIEVFAGTFVEQIFIYKDLTIFGAGEGATIIRAPSGAVMVDNTPNPGGFNVRSIVTVKDGVSVEMTDLTIDGPVDAVAGCATLATGIYIHEGAALDIQHVTVQDVFLTDTSLFGCQAGIGIQVGSYDDSSVGRLSMQDSTVQAYQKGGIVVSGDGSYAEIVDSSILGIGNDTRIAQNGIQYSDGATGIVVGSVIRDHLCDNAACGADPINEYGASGIILAGAVDVIIRGNTITDNDGGIYTYSEGTQILGNTVTGSRFYNVVLDEGDALVERNNISGGPYGVLVIGYDVDDYGITSDSVGTVRFNTISSTAAGIAVIDENDGDAYKPVVTANRNSITSNTAGFDNPTAVVMDGTCNWWGAANGPSGEGNGAGDTVSANVTFINWLSSTAPNLETAPCDGRPSGTITIRKDSQPDNGRDFRFTLTGQPPFMLDDDTNATLPNFRTFTNLPVGQYVVVETNVLNNADWDLTDILCELVGDDDDEPVIVDILEPEGAQVTITLGENQHVDCTFVNRARPDLTVRKFNDLNENTTRQHNEPWLPGWTFTLYDANNTPVGAPAVTNNQGRVNFNNLLPGTYTVCETLQTGWAPTTYPVNATFGQPCATVQLVYSQNVTLNFGNRELDPGSLEVTKAITWNGATPRDGETFEICVTGPSYADTSVPGSCKTFTYPSALTMTWTGLIPGQYSVSEPTLNTTFWQPVAAQNVSIAENQPAAITVTNRHVTPLAMNLTSDCPSGVFRVTNPNSYPVDYTWDVYNSNPLISGSGTAQPDENFGAINTGLTSGTVRLFVNGVLVSTKATKPPEQCTGRIETLKFNDLNANGTRDQGEEALPEWMISIYAADANPETAAPIVSGMTNANGVFFSGNLNEGSYLVCETLKSGWVNTDGSNAFVPGAARSCQTVSAVKGQTTHIDFGNVRTGTINIIKRVIGPENVSDTFEICLNSIANLLPENLRCQTTNVLTGGQSQTLTWIVPAGSYTFSETNPGAEWVIGYSPNNRTLNVVAGQSYMATVTNTYRQVACPATEFNEVISYQPGPTKNNMTVRPERQNEELAEGFAQNNDTLNFMSLGFGGVAVIEFEDDPVINGPGLDVRIVETSYGDANRPWSQYPERVRVEASQDNVVWVQIGETANKDESYDLGSLDWARYFRLTDISDVTSNRFPNNRDSDGFDIDAVEGLNCGEITSDVTVDKSAPTTATVGSQFDYTLTVSNIGLFSTTGVVVTDTLPAGVSFVSADVPYTPVGNVYTFNIGTLAPNAVRTIKIRVQADQATCVTNVAQVTSDDSAPDANPDNNRDEARTCITQPSLFVCSAAYAHEVVSYVPGTTRNGGAIPANRQVSGNALGAPQNQDVASPINFVSLGFGNGSTQGVNATSGFIVLKFAQLIVPNPLGPDLTIVETTSGFTYAQYPEQANVYVSLDGVIWYATVPASAQSDENVELPTDLPAYRYVKLVDVSDINFNFPGAASTVDAFDLDGIGACATQPLPTLTVVKVVDNTAGGSAQVSDFPLFVGQTSVVSGQANTFVPGDYVVSETNQPNYVASFSESCPNGQITLAPGQNATCTITNTYVRPAPQVASMTIVKDVLPGENPWVDFNFTGPNGAFVLDDDSDGTLSNTQPFDALPAGAGQVYTFSEDLGHAAAFGFELADITCQGTGSERAVINEDAGTVTFTPNAGDAVTCEFDNGDLAVLRVVKYEDMNGNGVEDAEDTTALMSDWQFTVTGPNGYNVTQSSYEFGNLVPGTYQICETDPRIATDGDWVNTEPTIASRHNDLRAGGACYERTMNYGDDWTFYFGNTERGSISIEKQTLPDGDQTEFVFTASYLDATFPLSDNEISPAVVLLPGMYTITETLPTQWELKEATCEGASFTQVNGGVTVTLRSGEDARCTFTNDFLEPTTGTIIIRKETNPDGAQDQFEFDPSTGENFFLADNGASEPFVLPPGSHTFEEIVPTGWRLVRIDCGEANATPTNNRISVSLTAGQTVTCVFHNERLSSLGIDKIAAGAGETSFGFTSTNQQIAPFSLTDAAEPQLFSNLPSGEYVITEGQTDGWMLQGIDCGQAEYTVDGSTVTVHLGVNQNITCTFTNVRVPVQDGGATITKQVVWNGQTPTEQTFNICLEGPVERCENVTITPPNTSGVATFGTLPAGEYTVTEPGVDVNTWTFTGTSVTVVAGQTASGTVTNSRNPVRICAPGIGVKNDLVISQTIYVDTLTDQAVARLKNNTALPCYFPLGLAVYIKYDENFNSQFMWHDDERDGGGLDGDGLPLVYLEPGQEVEFRANVPRHPNNGNYCPVQIDLFYGSTIEPNLGTNRYGSRLYQARHMFGRNYCFHLPQQNSAPTVQQPGDQAVAEGAPFSLQIVAADTQGDVMSLAFDAAPLTYSAMGLPDGLNIDANGLISGTPAAGSAGSYPVMVTVADGGQPPMSASVSFTLVVNAPTPAPVAPVPVITNTAPTVEAIAAQTTTVGQAIAALSVIAQDAEASTLSYNAAGLPDGILLDETTGAFSGAPATANIYTVTVTVSDGELTAETTFTWTVEVAVEVVPAPNIAPEITTVPGDTTNLEGDVVSLSVVATDADNDTLTFSAEGLPGGVSIDPSAGTLSGTIAAGSANTYSVTITVTDDEATDTAVFTWTITAPNAAPTATDPDAAAPIAYAEGMTVALQLVASDPEGGSLTYTLDAATPLPAGLTLNTATGLIEGVAQAGASLGGDAGAGVYTLRVVIADQGGLSTTIEFVITITAS